ncbi:hypothetical protein SCHPADRAFT_907805 [Schizopora paradoxa]|uniref:Uncharacterized protein n=1 Tax=Schizopora paradoxa TaxID=27342 RepID=A0A0H2RX08_9AGAM|nr:hypothetical protein SCHPADRAFT_907805 [Schizopora paradoxa]
MQRPKYLRYRRNSERDSIEQYLSVHYMQCSEVAAQVMVLFLRCFERSPGSPERVTKIDEDFPESTLRTPQGHTSPTIQWRTRSPQVRCEPVRSCCVDGDTPNSLRFIGS